MTTFRHPVDAAGIAQRVADALGPDTPASVRRLARDLASALGDRDRDVEDFISNIHELVIFSYPGTLVTGVESPPWHPRRPITFQTTRVSRRVAGASNVLIDVNVGGALAVTVTLLAGATTVVDTTLIRVPLETPVTAKVNTQGDGVDVTTLLTPL